MSKIIENIKEHLDSLRENTKISDIFVTDLSKLNEQLKNDVSAHHPFRGEDKAKHIIQINNNPSHEYEYVQGNWYSHPNRKKKFNSIEELAEHIENKIN
jgi:hypothetical protein